MSRISQNPGLPDLMSAIRVGDIRLVQSCLAQSAIDVNVVDEFDYSPLILYSVSVDSRQPFAAIVSSLLVNDAGGAGVTGVFLPRPSGDVYLTPAGSTSCVYAAHSFILSARSPYFKSKILSCEATEGEPITMPMELTPRLITCLLDEIYLVHHDEPSSIENMSGIQEYLHQPRSSRQEWLLPKKQRRAAAVENARMDFLQLWINYLNRPVRLHKDRVGTFSYQQFDEDVKSLRPDIILRVQAQQDDWVHFYGIHRAIIQSDFINTAIRFKEKFQASKSGRADLITVSVDVPFDIMEAVIKWFYTDMIDLQPELALDLLLAADMLLIERLKTRACMLITTQDRDELLTGDLGYSIFDVARTGWATGTFAKLDPFCAKFLASRLEHCLDPDSQIGVQFRMLVKDSAARIYKREETDTIEIVDDIRYYLSGISPPPSRN
ncbi:hypothetical protein ABW19_dt0209188 [Dactylella cylindrospora]|nr:hypothetical protein ABW19_dt0209188 [Dactylella cylindrospora]